MSKLRVGVVGSSFGGRVHVPSFRAQGTFEVLALASPHSAADVAAQLKIPNAFASTQAMLDGIDLDVVSVASPPFDHRPSVLAALARGKHVLCEKPFGLSVAECEEMLAASERAGTVCALAHEFRYIPARIAIRELIANGHLGPLRQLQIDAFHSFLRAGAEWPPGWMFERRQGGGLDGAQLSHLIDAANWLAGRAPVRSNGFTRTANPIRRFEGASFESDVADGAFATLDYGDGTVATLAADGTHALDSSLLAAHGELRTAVASGPNAVDVKLFLVDEDETAELDVKPAKHAKLASVRYQLPAFVALLDEFANAIAGKAADLPTFADGLVTQRVLASIGYGS